MKEWRSARFFAIFLFIFVVFKPSFSQNFDYQLQNSLQRMYANSDKNNEVDFGVFNKTFFCEGYSSFDYLSKILEKNKKLKYDHILFFHKVDSSQTDTFKTISRRMLNDKKYVETWVFSIDSLVDYLANVERFLPFLVNCMSNVYIALLAFLVVYGLLSFLRFIRLFAYDVKSYLSKNGFGSKLSFYLLAGIVLLAPVFLTIHVKFLPLYWLIVFFVYFSKKEKIIVFFAIAVMILVSFIGIFLTSFTTYFFQKKAFYYESLVSPFSGVGEAAGKGGDFENFAVGVSFLRGGKPIDGVKFLKRVNSDSSLYKYALNNIGVSYVLLSRPKLALNFFEQAVTSGLKFQSNINKFYLNNKLYNIVESEESLKSASKADVLGTARWLKLNIKEPYPLIAVPGFWETFKLIFNEFSFSEYKDSLSIPMFFLLFTLILIAISFITRDFSITKSCKRCGTPFKVFESQNDKLCTQCAIMKKSKGEMSQDMVEEKRREIKIYSALKRSFEIGLGVVLPGFYNICVLQRVFSGFLIFVLSVILVLDILKAYGIVGNFVIILPLIAMFVLLQLINLINVFFEREER